MRTERRGPGKLTLKTERGSDPALNLDFGRLETSPHVQSVALEAFERAAGPGGTWGSRRTFERGFASLVTFFRAVPTGRYGYPDEQRMLRHFDSISHANLSQLLPTLRKVFETDTTAPETFQQILASQKTTKPESPAARKITSHQFLLVQKESINWLRTAVRRVELGWAQIDSPPIWEPNTYSVEKKIHGYLQQIAETGDVDTRGGKSTRAFLHHRLREYCRLLGPTDKPGPNLFASLYPLAEDLAAATFALTTVCGWNLSIVPQLQVTDIQTTHTPNSKKIHTVTLRKPRRGGLDTWVETYIDDGPLSKGRVISLIQRLTQGVRRTFEQTNDPREDLLAYVPLSMNRSSSHTSRNTLMTLNEIHNGAVHKHLKEWLNKWEELNGTTPSDYRRYFVTSAHPQGHSREENLGYTRAQGMSETLIQKLSSGLTNAIGITDITVLNKDVISADDLWQTESAASRSDAVNSERNESGPSSCLDPEDHPETNAPCDSGFLTCFTCKNAVVLRRHVSSCIALRDHLNFLSKSLAPSLWTATHTNALSSLNHLLEPGRFFDADFIEQSERNISDQHLNIAKAVTNNSWLL